ncbi:M1 family metallopeptidase [Nonomuraea sp. MCN248]|uniref:Aminopeptidase N n=1 Tax=Nonomuraea corallina TaxID=2989783 RepID=A0ABT4SK79_9ACTN|nr:M1 family metallopeptidase [Nonomuraea corallina]MDA0637395.1 M1 family metallopeptidase [Nonomuraea corallina]
MRKLPLFGLIAALTATCCGAASAAVTPLADDKHPYSKGLSRPVRDPIYPAYGNPSIDVLHYGLKLAWRPDRRSLAGTATLTVRAVKPIKEIRLDFGRALKIDHVTVGGERARPRHTGDDLTIPLPATLATDKNVRLVVRYHGVPKPHSSGQRRPDLARLGLRSAADGSAWALQEPFGAFTWFPVNDHPSDEALYDIAITVPKGWAGVAHGTYQGRSVRGRAVTYRWRSTDPVASYLTVFTVDRYRLHRAKGPRGIPITYWVRGDEGPRALKAARRMPELLRWMEKKAGPYPFPSAGLVATSDSGMETQQMITLGGEYLTPAVVLHELAHHWFGNSVGPRTWKDVWLNEGFAMYFEIQWTADHSPGSMDQHIARARADERLARAMAGPPGDYRRDSFAAGNVYYGPALMLHEIRKRIGDKRFFAMTRAWAQEHRNTSQDRASFTAWVNRHTGENLTQLIDAWLDSPTTPGD